MDYKTLYEESQEANEKLKAEKLQFTTYDGVGWVGTPQVLLNGLNLALESSHDELKRVQERLESYKEDWREDQTRIEKLKAENKHLYSFQKEVDSMECGLAEIDEEYEDLRFYDLHNLIMKLKREIHGLKDMNFQLKQTHLNFKEGLVPEWRVKEDTDESDSSDEEVKCPFCVDGGCGLRSDGVFCDDCERTIKELKECEDC